MQITINLIKTRDQKPPGDGYYIVCFQYGQLLEVVHYKDGQWLSWTGVRLIEPAFWAERPVGPPRPSEFEIFWEKCGHKIFVSTEEARQVFDIVRSFLDENNDRNPNREAK